MSVLGSTRVSGFGKFNSGSTLRGEMNIAKTFIGLAPKCTHTKLNAGLLLTRNYVECSAFFLSTCKLFL